MAVGDRPRTERPKGPGVLGVIADKVFHNYVWQSIFRSGYPNTPRNQMLAVATNVFLHLHPTRIHKTHVKITHTYCLGGLSFFLFLGLTVTGVLLMFYYVPSVERAYGTFLRSFTLPSVVDTNKIKAEFKDGLLQLTLPKKEEAKPKQISINIAS